jgi:REP element-mobilizing transposase RayT
MRVLPVARTLRNGKLFREVHAAIARSEKPDFRVVHFSVQRDHLHLVVEADDRRALGRGMQGLAVRIAQRLNRRLGRRGTVFADRYHARVLSTPTEVRFAILYVVNNARHHAAQENATYPRGWIDPCSSAMELDGWIRTVHPEAGWLGRCTSPPRSWIVREGWKRAGLLDPTTTPGRQRPLVDPM